MARQRAPRIFPLAAFFLAGMSTAVLAQDEKPVAVTLDFGFVNTAGNTELTTVNAGERLVYTANPMVFAQTFQVIYGRVDGSTTASAWRAGARADYQFVERISVFALGGFERNTFAGILRRFEEAVGIAALLLDGGGNWLSAEAGVSLNQQTSTTDVDDNFIAGRAAAAYRRELSETAFFTQSVEFLPNFENTDDIRLNSETAVAAQVSTNMALKLAYLVKFDNVPEPTFVKTDRIFTAGVQVVF